MKTYLTKQIPPLRLRWGVFKFILDLAFRILLGQIPLENTLIGKELSLTYRVKLVVVKDKLREIKL